MAESIEEFGVTRDQVRDHQNYLLIPEKHFSWISESERQLSWIKRKLTREMADERIYSPALSERELLIATIDCAESPPRGKTSFLASLKRAWDEQRQLDQQWDWIKERNEREACLHVWEWLSKHLSNQVFPNPRPESHQHLLITLDSFTWKHEATREFITDSKRLGNTLAAWFRELFSGVYDDAYALKRLGIGMVHVRIGLPVRYPLAMLDVIAQHGEKVAAIKGPEAVAAFRKILALDVATFNQSYESKQLSHLAELTGSERLARRLLAGM
ncbi:protoglobin domain-containing protein [Pseudomonas sp. NY15437]|uniref:protoglobin domain-containing protein n=1 Tax=Pseudomonas sp. NY15437 TaxID=3400360 RepID=UPI003A8B0F61